jgi:hypothetical protein
MDSFPKIRPFLQNKAFAILASLGALVHPEMLRQPQRGKDAGFGFDFISPS